jgi:hypothetical protein
VFWKKGGSTGQVYALLEIMHVLNDEYRKFRNIEEPELPNDPQELISSDNNLKN